MLDLYTLFAKIQSLPKRRIAEVEDFVDFLALRKSQNAKAPLNLEAGFGSVGDANRPSPRSAAAPDRLGPLIHSIEGI